jgi:CheY-like chemotaxis protein
MLKDLGCEVVTAVSGTDAIERLSETRTSRFLVTYLSMPRLDGYEVVQRAAAIRPGL